MRCPGADVGSSWVQVETMGMRSRGSVHDRSLLSPDSGLPSLNWGRRVPAGSAFMGQTNEGRSCFENGEPCSQRTPLPCESLTDRFQFSSTHSLRWSPRGSLPGWERPSRFPGCHFAIFPSSPASVVVPAILRAALKSTGPALLDAHRRVAAGFVLFDQIDNCFNGASSLVLCPRHLHTIFEGV
jgi:hypothetical protein